MTDLPILRAGQLRHVQLDGVTYTLRALTYGEHADLQVTIGAVRPPGPQVIDDALHAAACAAGREDLAAAIVGCSDAQDALDAFYDAMPPLLDTAGRDQWLREREEEHRRLSAELRRAARRRQVALDLFGEAEGVAALRRKAADAIRIQAAATVAAGLVEIDGQPVKLDADGASDLPTAHVAALAQVVGEMLSPSRDAAKNS